MFLLPYDVGPNEPYREDTTSSRMRGCSIIGLRVQRHHHLQRVCLQDVVLVAQTDENRLGLSLVCQCYSIHLTSQT
ncbi:hypothetical protein AVEN_83864-1 [Araneus ventricosus]|uniref:Uncharacterized protein n=1 Tax=Araneus ventricosus TaxID=182803 RepID=A0A4Y2Q7Y2_ARAVE|nr:hypothetical protein AVEN_83864-1 [Araneus ventricosus]